MKGKAKKTKGSDLWKCATAVLCAIQVIVRRRVDPTNHPMEDISYKSNTAYTSATNDNMLHITIYGHHTYTHTHTHTRTHT